MTEDVKHTAEEWAVWSSLYEGFAASVVSGHAPGAELKTIAEVRDYRYAPLLAGAPTLLAALKALVALYEDDEGSVTLPQYVDAKAGHRPRHQPAHPMKQVAMQQRRFGGAVTWFFGPQGAHVRFPGFLYTRNNGHGFEWAGGRSWRFLGLVCLIHIDGAGSLKSVRKPGWGVTAATVDWRAILKAFRAANNHSW